MSKINNYIFKKRLYASQMWRLLWNTEFYNVGTFEIGVRGEGEGKFADEGSGVDTFVYNGVTTDDFYIFDVTVSPRQLKFRGYSLTKFSSASLGSNAHHDIGTLPPEMDFYNNAGVNTSYGDVGNLPSHMTYFNILGQNTVTGDIGNAPKSLLTFHFSGQNTITGDIANLPRGLSSISARGNNTIYGDWINLPTNMQYIFFDGNNTISGDISTMVENGTLTHLAVRGNNTLTGSILGIPTTCYSIEFRGNNTVSGDIGLMQGSIRQITIYGDPTLSYTAGKSWPTNFYRMDIRPQIGKGLTSAEVDAILIDLNNSGVTNGTNSGLVWLAGENSARTKASDTAKTNLESRGFTVVTNEPSGGDPPPL